MGKIEPFAIPLLLDNQCLINLHAPIEEARCALHLHLSDCLRCTVVHHRIEERRSRWVKPSNLMREAIIKGTLCLMTLTRRQDTLCNKVWIRVDIAHIVRVGVELLDDGRHHIYLHRITTTRQLHKGGVDRIINLTSLDYIARKEVELRFSEVIDKGDMRKAVFAMLGIN